MGIRLTWQNNSALSDAAEVYRSATPMDVGSLPAPLATLAASAVSYDDTSAVDGQTYYYRVAAVRGSSRAVSAELQVIVTSASQGFSLVSAGTVWTFTESAKVAELMVTASSVWHKLRVASAKSSGKWYAEFLVEVGSSNWAIGIAPSGTDTYSGVGSSANAGDGGRLQYFGTGQKRSGGTYENYGAAYAAGDRIGIALDRTAQQVTMYKNGVSQGVMYSLSAGLSYEPHLCFYGLPARVRIPGQALYLPNGFEGWS